jgi:hypothetical protein
MSRLLLVLCLILVCLSVHTGCNTSLVTVSGNVTVDGQPLAKGEIQFSPVDGGGTPVGAPIVAGKYAAQMTPGAKLVVISETLDTPVVTSTEELQRMAAEGKTPPPTPMSRITPQTKGNSSQVTVSSETGPLNFNLEVKGNQ